MLWNKVVAVDFQCEMVVDVAVVRFEVLVDVIEMMRLVAVAVAERW